MHTAPPIRLARLMKKERKSPKNIAAEAYPISWKVRIAKELRSNHNCPK